ncbi:MAG: hypothetical protein KF696_08415 [Planctomycetes bacterium]|nr:hypothetical protein [Planctomycetota bacterium]MCW8135625.1 hypothetical protein [Planctomycetota bacterium]
MRIPFCLVTLAACVCAGALSAVTVNVSNETELRQAISTINASAAAQDEIILAPGTYMRGAGTPAAEENANASGDYDITKAVSNSRVIIRGQAGQGASTIIDANNNDRVFHIFTTANITVEFRDLTLTRGRAIGDGASLTEARGGGILNRRPGTSATTSSVELHNVVIQDCLAIGEDGADGVGSAGDNGYAGKGGAIYSAGGTLRLENSNINNNWAIGGDGGMGDDGVQGAGAGGKNGGEGGAGMGGGIYVQAGALHMLNTAVTDNRASGGWGGDAGDGDNGAGGRGGAGGAGLGGGLYFQNGMATITDSSISENICDGEDGGMGGDGYTDTGGGKNGGDGGACGDVKGIGVYIEAGTVTMTRCIINTNEGISWIGGPGGHADDADSGSGGTGGTGGAGGVAQGGGVYVDNATVTLTRCTISFNHIWGGDGYDGGDGSSAWANTGSATGGAGGAIGASGDAEGGGLYLRRGNTTLIECTIEANICDGGGNAANQVAGIGGDGDGPNGNGGVGGQGGDGGAARGGGIYIDTAGVQARIERCLLAINACNGGGGSDGGEGGWGWANGRGGHGGSGGHGGVALGGGIYRYGGTQTIQIINCTITTNFCTGGDGAWGGDGGSSYGTGIDGNGGPGGNGGLGAGGASYVRAATVAHYNSTLSHNVVGSGGAGLGGSGQLTGATGTAPASAGGGGYREGGTVTSDSCIWSNNTATSAPDFSGAITASATLFGSDTGATITAGAIANILNQNPLLQALADNGGQTRTRALGGSSPALNAGSNTLTLQTDQRGAGFTRSYGSAPDIGAFEDQPAPGVNAPVVLQPAQAVTTSASSIIVSGTAQANALVRIYSDANSNGQVDIGEPVLGQQQLTGGGTSFSISINLTPNTVHNMLATAEDAGLESQPATVPTVTHDGLAPTAPVITLPAMAVTVSTLSYTIEGTAEADALVRIWHDANGNGVLDTGETVVEFEQLSGGATAFSISVSLTQAADNHFLATAMDAAGNESPAAAVPVITHQSSSSVPAPVITSPSSAIMVPGTLFAIQGTALAGGLVRIHEDSNANGVIDAGEPVVGQQQLGPADTAFSIQVVLNAVIANRFLATVQDGTGNVSAPAVVPTIRVGIPTSGGKKGGKSGGGCTVAAGPAPWVIAGLLLLQRRRRKDR